MNKGSTMEYGRFDINGYMNTNFKNVHTNLFVAIYEGLKNAIESVQTRQYQNNEHPKITIQIEFKQLLDTSFQPDKIIISDNGMGFVKDNFDRFNNFFVPDKGFNNHGTGRFQFLHNFHKVYVDSIYEENGKFFKRNLELSAQNAVVGGEQEEIKDKRTNLTTVTLSGIKLSDDDKNLFSTMTLNDFIKQIQLQFLVRLFLLKSEHNNNFPEITFVFKKDKEENITITEKDVIEPSVQGSIKIPYTQISNIEGKLNFITLKESEEIKFAKFEVESEHLNKNKISICSKGVEVETIRDPDIFTVRDDFSGKRIQASFFGGILDKPENITTTGNAFTFVTKKQVKEKFKDPFMGEYKYLLKDEICNKIIEKTKEICKNVQDLYTNKKELAKKIALDNGIPIEIVNDIEVLTKDTERTLTFKVYKAQAEHLATNALKLKQHFESIDMLDPSSETYQTDMEQKITDVSQLIENQDKEELAKYIVRRKYVLNIFEKLLKNEMDCQHKTSGKNILLEGFFHDMFLKKGTTTRYLNDLWVLNEEYIYCDGASDIPLKDLHDKNGNMLLTEIPDDVKNEFQLENDLKQKPDIYFFLDDGKCIIIELKAPTVKMRDYLDQLPRYARIIANFSKTKINQFFCYLIGENVVEKRDLNDYSECVSGCWAREDTLKSYDSPQREIATYRIEVWKLSAILERAKKRNKIFFQKLGIDEDIRQFRKLVRQSADDIHDLWSQENLKVMLSQVCLHLPHHEYDVYCKAASCIGEFIEGDSEHRKYKIPPIITSLGKIETVTFFITADYSKCYFDSTSKKVTEKKEVKVERPGFLVCARISPKETINNKKTKKSCLIKRCVA